jgi:hypothetical protein
VGNDPEDAAQRQAPVEPTPQPVTQSAASPSQFELGSRTTHSPTTSTSGFELGEGRQASSGGYTPPPAAQSTYAPPAYTPTTAPKSRINPGIIGGIAAGVAALAFLYFTGVIGGAKAKPVEDYFVPIVGYEYAPAPEGFEDLMNNVAEDAAPGFGDEVSELAARSVNQNGTLAGIMIVIVAENPDDANEVDLQAELAGFESGFGSPGRIEQIGGRDTIVAEQAGQTAFAWVQDGAFVMAIGPPATMRPFAEGVMAGLEG